MHLILHLGAHGTDGGQLAEWLARNRTTIEGAGAVVPAPSAFLGALSRALQDTQTDPQVREEALLRSLGASGQRRVMIASVPGLLGAVPDVVSVDGFYARDVARRLLALRTLLPRCRFTFLLAVRRPSALMTTLFADDPALLRTLLPHLGEQSLPWARVPRLIQRQFPQSRIVVWRFEDLARVWPSVLGVLSGPSTTVPAAGLVGIAAAGLTHEGRYRVERYLRHAGPVHARALRDIVAAFAKGFSAPAATAPNSLGDPWVDRHLSFLDLSYETEWAEIEGTRGISVLRP